MNERQIFLTLIGFSYLFIIALIWRNENFLILNPNAKIGSFAVTSILMYAGYFVSYKWNSNYYPNNFTDSEINWSNFGIYFVRYAIVLFAGFILLQTCIFLYNNGNNVLRILSLLALGLGAIAISIIPDNRNIGNFALSGLIVCIMTYLLIRWSFITPYFFGLHIEFWLKVGFVLLIVGIGIFLSIEGEWGYLPILIAVILGLFLVWYWNLIDLPIFNGVRQDPGPGGDPSTIEVVPESQRQ